LSTYFLISTQKYGHLKTPYFDKLYADLDIKLSHWNREMIWYIGERNKEGINTFEKYSAEMSKVFGEISRPI